MTRLRALFVSTAGLLLSCAARAAVVDVAPNGFALNIPAHIDATPDKVYAALIEPSLWWSSEHTFSGNAQNLHLEAKAGGCWCESLPSGGSAQHLSVVYIDPGKSLRLRGALGPFQGLGVDGAMTWKLKPAATGTDLVLTYTLGGYNKDGFADLSAAADKVLTIQVERLKRLLETKSPEVR